MTADEFTAAYLERSNRARAANGGLVPLTRELLREHGREARPCVCEADDCEGWQMAHLRDDPDWPAGSPFPRSDPRFTE